MTTLQAAPTHLPPRSRRDQRESNTSRRRPPAGWPLTWSPLPVEVSSACDAMDAIHKQSGELT